MVYMISMKIKGKEVAYLGISNKMITRMNAHFKDGVIKFVTLETNSVSKLATTWTQLENPQLNPTVVTN